LIRKEIENTLGISAQIKLVEPKTIARSEGKASASSTSANSKT